MNVKKAKISQRFDSASRSYDSVAWVQKQSALMLTHRLKEKWPHYTPRSVLDLGTGTGYLAELLHRMYPHCPVTLNDISPQMLARAEERLGSSCLINYQLGDIETAEFACHDLIVSNLALQWMAQLESTLRACYQKSNVMAFTCLLDGTFQEWGRLLQPHQMPSPVHAYPTRHDLEQCLLKFHPRDYSFSVEAFKMTFQNAHAFMLYLKQLGASVTQNPLSLSQLRQLIQGENHPFDVTYHVFFGLLER